MASQCARASKRQPWNLSHLLTSRNQWTLFETLQYMMRLVSMMMIIFVSSCLPVRPALSSRISLICSYLWYIVAQAGPCLESLMSLWHTAKTPTHRGGLNSCALMGRTTTMMTPQHHADVGRCSTTVHQWQVKLNKRLVADYQGRVTRYQLMQT